ncbi:hypothetical protein JCM5296_002035, partial [Sporobolomyces johnsonii]
KTAEGVRDRLGFALGHYGLLRSSNILPVELPDLFSLDLPDEGPSPCFAVVVLLDNGKTNKDGRKEYAAFTRHEDPAACGVGALAFYFFQRFHVSQERFPPHDTAFPSFAASRDWFDLKVLLSSAGPTEAVEYGTFLAAVNKELKALGLETKAKTHIFRGSGSRMADLGGAAKADIRQAGRWNVDAVDRCYLTGLAREVIRVQAGFESRKGTYFLRRDIDPPAELERQVFPEADEWLHRQEAGTDVEQTICGQGFLRLLIRLRRVLLQDVACLRLSCPSHPVFLHPLFSTPAFAAFEEKMQEHLRTVHDPAELQLQRVLPLLERLIVSSFAAQRQETLGLKGTIDDLSEQMEKVGSDNNNLLHDVLSGRIPITINAQLAPSSSPSSPSTPTTTVAAAALAANTTSSSSSSSASPASPAFSMNRKLTTVDEVWREWTEGLGGGQSVAAAWPEGSEALKAMKKVEKDRKHYQRRGIIVSRVRAIMEERNVEAKRAVEAVDAFRRAQKNKSLDALRKALPNTPSEAIPLLP